MASRMEETDSNVCRRSMRSGNSMSKASSTRA